MHTDAVYPCAFCTFNIFVFPEHLCSRNIRVPGIFVFPDYSCSLNIRVPGTFVLLKYGYLKKDFSCFLQYWNR